MLASFLCARHVVPCPFLVDVGKLLCSSLRSRSVQHAKCCCSTDSATLRPTCSAQARQTTAGESVAVLEHHVLMHVFLGRADGKIVHTRDTSWRTFSVSPEVTGKASCVPWMKQKPWRSKVLQAERRVQANMVRCPEKTHYFFPNAGKYSTPQSYTRRKHVQI